MKGQFLRHNRSTLISRFSIALCLFAIVLTPLRCAHANLPTIHCVYMRSIYGKTRHNRGDPDAAYIWERASSSPPQHVVGYAAQTKPSVRIAGMDLPATAIREGNFERVDLTLLSIDEQSCPFICRCAACRYVKNAHGPVSRSSSRFPTERRARMSCRRRYFPITSEGDFPR